MPTLTQKTSNKFLGHGGFSLIEILVALLLAALVFLAVPSGDSAQKHRELKTAIDDFDRSTRFAANEAVLRNTVVRLRIQLDKTPQEFTVEYGPPGNIPLPEASEKKTNLSLSEEKAEADKQTDLDRQFTKVEEFEEIKREIHPDVTIYGVATTTQQKLLKEGDVSIYFYPTGEKDGALVFVATIEEMAWLEVSPFLTETTSTYEIFKAKAVAKLEDVVSTRMDELYKEWMGK
jgi:prepilin-type N-terminal cleavage/methylation domain-containing protein